MLQLFSRTLLAGSEHPTPVTLIGFPTRFRWSWRASASSTSVFDEPVSIRNGNTRPWITTRASARVSPSLALRITSGTVACASCAPPTDASPHPVNATSNNEPTRPATRMRRPTVPPLVEHARMGHFLGIEASSRCRCPRRLRRRGRRRRGTALDRIAARCLHDRGARQDSVRSRNARERGGADLRRGQVDSGGLNHFHVQPALGIGVREPVDAVIPHAPCERQLVLRPSPLLLGLGGRARRRRSGKNPPTSRLFAPLNWGEAFAPSPTIIEIWVLPPEIDTCGSGKFDTPCSRMHAA